MPKFNLRTPAHLVLMLTWLLMGMYYASRFNFSSVLPLIKVDLDISNTQVGWLMAFFFISYTVFQIPSGLIGDKIGPRRALTWGAVISIVGNLIFSWGATFEILAFGQFVNGAGQAMGWNSAIKMIVNWFPRSQRATAIGIFITCVTAGSSFGIRLSGFLGNMLGWRSSFIILPALLAVVVTIFWVAVRDTPAEKGLPPFEDEIHLEAQVERDPRSTLAMILANPTLWVVGLVYFCFVYVQFGCLVWIPSFVKETYALSLDRASTVSALVLLPGVFAAPVAGYLSDYHFKGRRKPLIIFGMVVLSAASFILSIGPNLILAMITLSLVGLMIIMPDILLASIPSDLFSRKLAATAMGFLATFTSTAGIVSTPVTGKIVDLTSSYSASFFSFGVVAMAGAGIALLVREKNRLQPE